jgi:opacity protein-like surface antigen
MVIVRTGVIGVALLAVTASETDAAGPQGLYLKVSGMWVQQEDSDVTSLGGVPLPLDASVEFDSGYGVLGGIGYTLSLGLPVSLSVELEYAFRAADADTLTNPLVPLPLAGGNDSHSVMVNAIAGLELGAGFGLYGGAGLGATITTADLAVDLGGGLMISLPSEDDTTFSWQVLGGVSFSIGGQLMLYGGVRYFDAGDVDFDSFDGENSSFAIEAGLRVYF